MATKTVELRPGMAVRDMNGEEIGTVAEVWPFMPEKYTEAPPTPGQEPPDPGDVGYFSVQRGGVLGVGATHLYLPFKTIRDVELGASVTVSCTKEQCDERYSNQPWFAQRDAG